MDIKMALASQFLGTCNFVTYPPTVHNHPAKQLNATSSISTGRAPKRTSINEISNGVQHPLDVRHGRPRKDVL